MSRVVLTLFCGAHDGEAIAAALRLACPPSGSTWSSIARCRRAMPRR
jgi:hypothetical protein